MKPSPGEGTHSTNVEGPLGHSPITLPLDTYCQMVPGLYQEVAAQRDRLFEAPGDPPMQPDDGSALRPEGVAEEPGESPHA